VSRNHTERTKDLQKLLNFSRQALRRIIQAPLVPVAPTLQEATKNSAGILLLQRSLFDAALAWIGTERLCAWIQGTPHLESSIKRGLAWSRQSEQRKP